MHRYAFNAILYGIGLWIVTWVVGIIIRSMDGIDKIESDIALILKKPFFIISSYFFLKEDKLL